MCGGNGCCLPIAIIPRPGFGSLQGQPTRVRLTSRLVSTSSRAGLSSFSLPLSGVKRYSQARLSESVRPRSVERTQGVSRAGLPGPWGVRHGRSHKGFSRARDSHPPPAQPTRGYRRFVRFASVSGKDHATWVRTRPSSSLCATPTRPIGLHPTPPGRHHGRRPSAGGFIPRRMKHPASVPPQTEVCRWLCPKKWCNKVGAIPVCCV